MKNSRRPLVFVIVIFKFKEKKKKKEKRKNPERRIMLSNDVFLFMINGFYLNGREELRGNR